MSSTGEGFGGYGFPPLGSGFGRPVSEVEALRAQAGQIERERDQLRVERDELRQVIQAAKDHPSPAGTVLQIRGKKTTLAINSSFQEVKTPTHLDGEGFAVGAQVSIDPKSLAIVGVLHGHFQIGLIHAVVRLIDERHVEVLAPGESPKIVLAAPCAGELRNNDRVLLDPCGAIVVRNFGPEEPDEAPGVETGVDWDDIGGLEQVKRDLREAVSGPVENAARYLRYKRKACRGALLCGPPGCGKTHLARALATEMARLHGAKYAASGYVYVKGPALLNRFVGQSEENVRKLFDDAKKHKAKHGYPALICLDEGEALLGRRGAQRMEGMERTIVPTFNAEMDGIDELAAFVLVLTNRVDMIDPAILRRLPLKVYVTRPTKEAAADIAGKHLRGKPVSGIDASGAAQLVAEEVFAPKRVLYNLKPPKGLGERFTLGDIASGQMMEEIVDRAAALAIERETATGTEDGISEKDLVATVQRIFEEQRLLEHVNDLTPRLEKLGPGWTAQKAA